MNRHSQSLRTAPLKQNEQSWRRGKDGGHTRPGPRNRKSGKRFSERRPPALSLETSAPCRPRTKGQTDDLSSAHPLRRQERLEGQGMQDTGTVPEREDDGHPPKPKTQIIGISGDPFAPLRTLSITHEQAQEKPTASQSSGANGTALRFIRNRTDQSSEQPGTIPKALIIRTLYHHLPP